MIWPCVFSGDDGHVRVCVCGGGEMTEMTIWERGRVQNWDEESQAGI